MDRRFHALLVRYHLVARLLYYYITPCRCEHGTWALFQEICKLVDLVAGVENHSRHCDPSRWLDRFYIPLELHCDLVDLAHHGALVVIHMVE